MCFDEVGLLVGLGFLFGFAEFLDQTHGTALEASVEAAAGAGMEDVEEFVGGEIEQSVAWLDWLFEAGLGRAFLMDLKTGIMMVDVLIEIDASE